jgi:hypothetical protein
MGEAWMPMTGWGHGDGVVVDDGEPATVEKYADLFQREYVVVPHDVLPAAFALATAALAHYYACELGIAVPPIHFFAQMTPELRPWLERIEPRPEERARYLFRDGPLRGFADETGIWIDVAESGADLVEIVAHEVAHVAGYDERAAQAYGLAAVEHRGG